jgi:F0F1-type ATP synthase assembly protein I
MARLIGVGWFLALALVGGPGLGYWVDGQLGTTPVFTLVGLFAGLIIGLVGAYRMLVAASDSERRSGR